MPLRDLPASHIQEAMKLEARALVELFQIDLYPPGETAFSLFLSPTKTVDWQGRTWEEGMPCTISETSLAASGEVTRPKFTIVNPAGVWSRYVHKKWADNAIVSRYRVLRPDLDADVNAFQFSSWRLSKVLNLGRNNATFELRTALDGQAFKIPSETFRPPKYPAVSVQ